MATYAQLETIIRDVAFQSRVLWACRVTAESLWADAGATALQKKWASKVRQGQPINLTAVCAQLFKDAGAAGTVSESAGVVSSSATDTQIQNRINSLVTVNDDLIALGLG